MSSPDLREFLAGFVVEAEDHVRAIRESLVRLDHALESGSADPNAIRTMFRALHTLKGIAGMVGVTSMVTLSHAMESVLRPIDRGSARVDRETIETLLASLHELEAHLRGVDAGSAPHPVSSAILSALAELEARLDSISTPEPSRIRSTLEERLSATERDQVVEALGRGRHAMELEFRPSAERAAAGTTITWVREQVAALAEIIRVQPITVTSEDSDAGIGFVFLVVIDPANEAALRNAVGHVLAHAVPVGLRDEATPTKTDAAPTRSESPVAPAPVPPASGSAGPGSAAPGSAASSQATTGPSTPAAPPHRSHRPTSNVSSPRRSLGPSSASLDIAALEGGATTRVVRVDVSRVDEALEHAAAVLVWRERLRHELGRLERRGVDVRDVRMVLEAGNRPLRDLRASVLGLRLVPLDQVLASLPLLVRGLEASTGKAVELEIATEGAELDKSVADRLWPALVHLIRNAVDHGIEDPVSRLAAGKPRAGRLKVRTQQRRATRVEIIVEDDGRGVDAAAVARRAGQPIPSTDARLLELITAVGVSTRDAADTTSGRGLGLDIVRRVVVDELGGELLLESHPGQGTSFLLRVPITVAVVEAFRVGCGDQTYLVPSSTVEELVEVTGAELTAIPRTRAQGDNPPIGLLHRRGVSMPLIDLDEALGRVDPSPSDARVAANLPRSPKAVVVRRGKRPFAFGVERLLGHHDVVVRPVTDPLITVPGISGSADLGDGRPTLLLDLVALSQKLETQPMGRPA